MPGKIASYLSDAEPDADDMGDGADVDGKALGQAVLDAQGDPQKMYDAICAIIDSHTPLGG